MCKLQLCEQLSISNILYPSLHLLLDELRQQCFESYQRIGIVGSILAKTCIYLQSIYSEHGDVKT